MKVLLINNFFYRRGGSEVVFFQTGDLLARAGNEVCYFSFADEKNLPCAQSAFFPARPAGRLAQLRGYFYNREVARKLDELVRAEKPDIAHVHLLWGGVGPAIFKVLRRHGIPLVHTVHDYRMVCPAYTFRDGTGAVCERCAEGSYWPCVVHRCAKGRRLESLTMALEMRWRRWFHDPLKHIGGFIFVSRFAESIHLRIRPDFALAPRTVLYNCVPDAPVPEPERGDYYLYYGRLSHEKGVETLLKQFASRPELRLKVVGTGPLEAQLRAAATENVTFLGYRSGEELFSLVRGCSFVIVPSQWYENNPMTVLESYSFGKPVLGAAIGGIPEIVQDGVTGFVFRDLSQALSRAEALSPEAYRRMGLSAYSAYRDRFSETEHYKRLVAFYQKVISTAKEQSGRLL